MLTSLLLRHYKQGSSGLHTHPSLASCIDHHLVKLSQSQWWRSVARWWKGAAFTEKMNVELEDEEFAAVDVESRGSEPNEQSKPPEFTGTKASEFKSYREKVKLWLLFTRTPAQLRGPRALSRLTGPAWDACDGLEPEDVATDDGVNVIPNTLAEASQGEHETELFDTKHSTRTVRHVDGPKSIQSCVSMPVQIADEYEDEDQTRTERPVGGQQSPSSRK